jgi:hypothetical protein
MSKMLAFCLGAAALSLGCAGKPAAPFDTLKTSNLTAYRLQNYEPPVAVAAAPGAPGAPVIPGLPPEIQTWIQQGAAGLQQLIPPGLQIPGLPPVAGAAPAPAVDTTPRFHTSASRRRRRCWIRILKEELGKPLGDKDSFGQRARAARPTFYAEMGLLFGSAPGAQTNDLLVSFSCNQIVSRSFSWPHPATGMKTDTVKEL